MKLIKLIAITTMILGAVQFRATADVGLNITINSRFIIQNTNSTTNPRTGTVTVSPAVQRSFSSINLLNRLAVDENIAGNFDSTTFPRGSRIVATNGTIVVMSGTNVLVDVSNILSVQFGDNTIFSGGTDTNGLARPSQTRIHLANVNFDDTSINTTDGLRFFLQGIMTEIRSDGAPNNSGVFTESQTISMPSSAGEGSTGVGSGDERQIIVSGSLFGNGRGTQTLVTAD